MGDMLRDALAHLTDTLAEHAAQAVTYTRGAESVEVRATFGQKLLKLADVDGGIVMQWTDMDFCIPAADLVLGGAAVEPRRGDQIAVTIGETVQTFEVFPFGNEPHWRWSDPNQTMIRVHTKRLRTEPLSP